MTRPTAETVPNTDEPSSMSMDATEPPVPAEQFMLEEKRHLLSNNELLHSTVQVGACHQFVQLCRSCCPQRTTMLRGSGLVLLALLMLNVLCRTTHFVTGIPPSVVVAALFLATLLYTLVPNAPERPGSGGARRGIGNAVACWGEAMSAEGVRRLKLPPPDAEAMDWGRWGLRTLLCPTISYCMLAVALHITARIAIYPGAFILNLNQRLQPEAVTTFSFVSEFDGKILQGARQLFALEGSLSPVVVVPVVFIGGNGGNVWFNLQQVKGLVTPMLNSTLSVEVFAYSFRGYTPHNNQPGYHPSERALVADSVALYRYAASQYDGRRPLLFSHSLGTAAASAVTANLAAAMDADKRRQGGDNMAVGLGPLPACLLLGSPFTSMAQVVLEMTWFASWPWIYLADTWDTVDRLQRTPSDLPLLVLSPLADTLVPSHFHRLVYEGAASMPELKMLLTLAGAGHNALGAVVEADAESKAVYALFLRRCFAGANV